MIINHHTTTSCYFYHYVCVSFLRSKTKPISKGRPQQTSSNKVNDKTKSKEPVEAAYSDPFKLTHSIKAPALDHEPSLSNREHGSRQEGACGETESSRKLAIHENRTNEFISAICEQYNNDLDADDSDSTDNKMYTNGNDKNSRETWSNRNGSKLWCGKERQLGENAAAPFVFSKWTSQQKVIATVFPTCIAIPQRQKSDSEHSSVDLD